MQYEVVQARPHGFFSNVYSVLGAIHWCEEHGSKPVVRFDSGPYLDPEHGPNWWEYFFERLSELDPMSLPVRSEPEQVQRSWERSRDLAHRVLLHRSIAADLIQRHLRVRPEVLQFVSSFHAKHLKNQFTIGIHLRGTDKWIEAPLPSIEELCAYLSSLLDGMTPDSWRLFVATDQSDYLRKMQERFGDQLVCLDALRSDDGQPLHKVVSKETWKSSPCRNQPHWPEASQPPYRIGLEAIQDALLLARSNLFFGSQSNLSYFVAAYNPYLPWVHLGGIVPAVLYRDALDLARCQGRYDQLINLYPSLADIQAEKQLQAVRQAAAERLQLINLLTQRIRELEASQSVGFCSLKRFTHRLWGTLRTLGTKCIKDRTTNP